MLHFCQMDSLPFQYQKRSFWVFYCPICKRERRSFFWPSPRIRHYAALLITTLVFTLGLWRWFGFKTVFLGIPLWAIFEFVYRFKARESLICPHCGFDPYLYKYDVKLARDRVAKFFEAKNKTPEPPTPNSNSNIEPDKDEKS